MRFESKWKETEKYYISSRHFTTFLGKAVLSTVSVGKKYEVRFIYAAQKTQKKLCADRE